MARAVHTMHCKITNELCDRGLHALFRYHCNGSGGQLSAQDRLRLTVMAPRATPEGHRELLKPLEPLQTHSLTSNLKLLQMSSFAVHQGRHSDHTAALEACVCGWGCACVILTMSERQADPPGVGVCVCLGAGVPRFLCARTVLAGCTVWVLFCVH